VAVASEKRCVLSSRRKVSRDLMVRRGLGKLFHTVGAATEKDRVDNLRRVRGTVSKLSSLERRVREGVWL